MLVEKNLFEQINKIEIAIERLKTFEPKEGYYLAFSGGKDSIVIKKLAEMSDVKFESHYNYVGIDPPELVKFIKKYHKDVFFEKPEVPFFKQFIKSGYPTRQMRWCCELLKEKSGNNRFIITGIRWAESTSRKNRKMVEFSNKENQRKRFLNLIIDWSNEDVWDFIKLYKIPYCELYDRGWERVGCLFCPMNRKNRLEQVELYPKFRKAFIIAFNKRYEYCEERGLTMATRFDSGEDAFWYWIKNKSKEKIDEDQCLMFE